MTTDDVRPKEKVHVAPEESEEGNDRLDRWVDRTTTPLDLLALCTVWLVAVPIPVLDDVHRTPLWLIGRLMLSAVYLIDIVVRVKLARRMFHYFITHPVGSLAVILPAVRVFFSLRLLRELFRRGNLRHFLFAAFVTTANLTFIVYCFESTTSQGNIKTLRDSFWWACVTLSTVGYGDYYPVTFWGRLAAIGVMVIGLVTLAVITATIASTFNDQMARNNANAKEAEVLEKLKTLEEKLDRYLQD